MPFKPLPLFAALVFSTSAAQSTQEALAVALQDAARQGNAQAYTALLAPSGTFAVEGPNFAADLGRVPQPTATFQFMQLSLHGAEARAQLNLAWNRVPNATSRVTLPVRLLRQGEVWRYAGEDFNTLPAGEFTLLALNTVGLTARSRAVGPLLSRAAQRVKEAAGLDVPTDASVKVYPDMPSLSASVALSLQPVSGWNEPGEAIKLVLPTGERAEAETLRVLSHEFTHLSLSRAVGFGRDKRLPWWLHEGLADFVARAFWADSAVKLRDDRIRRDARDGWMPLRELAVFNSVPEDRWPAVYAQGLGVVEFLTATQGQDAPVRLALAFADTDEADAAAARLGFASFGDFERQARDWLTLH